ncbi:cell division protein ZipA [Idiomarina xiamenensis]|uniref:Cell division protein ZipA n=1 Tax=Idiomarina xiamenensis 10-D-4 TaxID=740709 RepID=K2KPD9_9GAMM|nr:cell division protein ZipA [Idiomarina xiamenensis]EKE84259.1 secreted cell division protein [Idiomarina xiamenensis 10-D-4]
MNTLQISLTILSVVAILAITAHGLWRIRRNDANEKANAAELARKRQQRQAGGFDEDGIGEVRVVKRQQSTAKRFVEPSASDDEQLEANQAAPALRAQRDDPIAADAQLGMSLSAEDKPVVAPSTPAKETAKAAPASHTKTAKPYPPAQESLALDEIDEPASNSDDEASVNAEPQDVIALHVVGKIEGAVLLQMVTELGLKYGEMDIFHRHASSAGTGAVLFSMANMFNPGTFDLDNMENFGSEGVVLFMTLPLKYDAIQAFNMMHNAALKLAAAFVKGQVLDGHRNPLTRQAVQHTHQRIREFERQQLLRQ